MILTAGQLGYLPWLGFFAKIAAADVFCSFDAVQYEKRGWNNRNYIKTANGPLMLSVPVLSKDHFSKRLCEIEIVPGGWARKHLRSIDLAYHKAPYFKLYYEALVDIILPYATGGLLCDLNENLLRFFMAKMGMERPIVRASSYQFNGNKSDLVLDMCLQLKATSYIFGGEGKSYADAQGFRNAGVEPIFQQYAHPVYPQLHGALVEDERARFVDERWARFAHHLERATMSSVQHTDHGFDYGAAVSELLKKFTYREIADRLGYSSVGSITSILDGKIPSHHHGEALWVLYKRIYGRRPPLTDAQRIANSLTHDLQT